MSYETILFSLEHGVARVTLNRPDRLNAFNEQMHADLADALTKIEDSQDARVLLLTGAGRGFCAGQDLGDRQRAPGDPPRDLGKSVETFYNPLIRRLAALRIPVICAVNGVAAGAGANIALACDLVIARSDARFVQSFVNIGLISDSGGTWILPRLAGQARAMGVLLTGEPITAATAAEWGLIWRAIDAGQFDAEVAALTEKLAGAPPLALAAMKQAVRGAWTRDLDAQLDVERDLQRKLGFSADYAEGVAAFGEKRPAVFRGA